MMLQSADHRLEESAARAHENEDVARRDRARRVAAAVMNAIGPNPLPISALILRATRSATTLTGVVLGWRIDRDRPVLGIVFLLARRAAARSRRGRASFVFTLSWVGQPCVRGGNAVLVQLVLEDRIDGRRECPAPIETRFSTRRVRTAFRPDPEAALELRAHVVEHQRRGALERKNRLLVIADDEEAAVLRPGRGACRRSHPSAVPGSSIAPRSYPAPRRRDTWSMPGVELVQTPSRCRNAPVARACVRRDRRNRAAPAPPWRDRSGPSPCRRSRSALSVRSTVSAALSCLRSSSSRSRSASSAARIFGLASPSLFVIKPFRGLSFESKKIGK